MDTLQEECHPKCLLSKELNKLIRFSHDEWIFSHCSHIYPTLVSLLSTHFIRSDQRFQWILRVDCCASSLVFFEPQSYSQLLNTAHRFEGFSVFLGKHNRCRGKSFSQSIQPLGSPIMGKQKGIGRLWFPCIIVNSPKLKMMLSHTCTFNPYIHYSYTILFLGWKIRMHTTQGRIRIS